MQVVTQPSGVKVYHAAIRPREPEFLDKKKTKNQTVKNIDNKRLDLIQDLSFPSSSQKIKQTPAGDHILAIGTYAPQVRCWDLSQMSIKFQRNLNREIVQFLILAEDYSKLVFLRSDRYLEFHTVAEKHAEIRIPKYGRDIIYQPSTCDLLAVGSSNEIFRLNLEQGCFLKPYESQYLPEINVADINSVHELMCFGGTNGVIECWDPRERKSLTNRDIGSVLSATNELSESPEITALKFDKDGLTLGVGTSSGHTLLFDIRSSKPLVIKDHYYGYPIKSIQFHEKKLFSADTKILKIWELDSQQDKEDKVWASIEPTADINDVLLIPNSGLLMMSLQQPDIPCYFVPALGPAPKWCSFLENLTEELEEQDQQLYRDYKFVTKEELAKLGLTKLIGTEKLRAYMHGYFIDLRLYQKFKAIVEPFEFEKYKEEKAKEKLDKESENRIRLKPKMPKVNAKTATRLIKEGKSTALMEDDRFKEMFEKNDFQVDERDDRFKFYHQNSKEKISQQDIEDHFEKVNDEEGEEAEEEDDELDEGDEENEEEEDEEDSDEEKPTRKVQFFEIKTGHENLVHSKSYDPSEKNLTFEERLQRQSGQSSQRKESVYGSKELTFTLNSVKQQQHDQVEKSKQQRKEYKKQTRDKRSISTLPLQKLPEGRHYRRK